MYISLSKALKLCGGFRLGAGLRITKKNAPWMLFIWLFVITFQMMWYMIVLCCWLMYAVCYGLIWCIKAMWRGLKSLAGKASEKPQTK